MYIYILGVFTEKPYERNVVYIPIITLSHMTSHDFKWRQNKLWLSIIWLDVGDELNFSDVYWSVNYIGSPAKFPGTLSGFIFFARDPM